MLHSFSKATIQVVDLARAEAVRRKQPFVATHDLLLGLSGVEHGLTADALSRSGIRLERLRSEVDKHFGPAPTGVRGDADRWAGHVSGPSSKDLLFMPRVTSVFESAREQALELASAEVQPEHLLLAILLEPQGTALYLLDQLGLDVARVEAVVQFLRGKGELATVPESEPVSDAYLVDGNFDFGNYLIGQGQLTRSQLDEAIQHQRALAHQQRFIWLGEVLVEMSFLDAGQVQAALAYFEQNKQKA